MKPKIARRVFHRNWKRIAEHSLKLRPMSPTLKRLVKEATRVLVKEV